MFCSSHEVETWSSYTWPLLMPNQEKKSKGDLAVKEKIKVKKPPKYKVLLHNDDYTPMDFVVQILQIFFLFSAVSSESTQHNILKRSILPEMLQIHRKLGQIRENTPRALLCFPNFWDAP